MFVFCVFQKFVQLLKGNIVKPELTIVREKVDLSTVYRACGSCKNFDWRLNILLHHTVDG